MANAMAQFELAAILRNRAVRAQQVLSGYPSMEESFRAIPALEEGLMQALVVMDMVIQQPELAPYLNRGGLPYEQN
jgi:hypothetical protein